MVEFNDWYYEGTNKIHKTALINWDVVKMGENNIIGPYTCIGTDAQSIKDESTGVISIGNNNIFREAVSVNMPTGWSKLTAIEDNCYLMINSNIAHDCYVESNCIISNNAAFGGHVYLMKNTNVGYSVSIHQFQVIGSYCMLGMGTIIPKNRNITSGTKWSGNPAKLMGKNEVGLKRNGLDVSDMVSEDKRRQSIIDERSKYNYE